MNLPDILFYSQKLVTDSAGNISDEFLMKPGACGEWSVKDILAHITSYEFLLLDVFKFVKHQKDTPYLHQLNTEYKNFNTLQVNAYKNKSKKNLLQEFMQAYDGVLEQLKNFTPSELRKSGTIPWYGTQYSLDDFVVYANYAHFVEHTTQIKLFLEQTRMYSSE
jgi:uncharacterized damage-inducible protein DinB